jgi:hypothetical protein
MLQNRNMQSNSKIQALRDGLSDFSPVAIEELKFIITSGKASIKNKLDAIEMLFDRIGLPAVRASISQNIPAHSSDVGSLIEEKTQLMLESQKLSSELNDLENKVGKDRKA